MGCEAVHHVARHGRQSGPKSNHWDKRSLRPRNATRGNRAVAAYNSYLVDRVSVAVLDLHNYVSSYHYFAWNRLPGTSMTLVHALRRSHIGLRCICRRYASDNASQLASNPKKPAAGKSYFTEHRTQKNDLHWHRYTIKTDFNVSSGHYSTWSKLLERPATCCSTCRRRISRMALDDPSTKGIGRWWSWWQVWTGKEAGY